MQHKIDFVLAQADSFGHMTTSRSAMNSVSSKSPDKQQPFECKAVIPTGIMTTSESQIPQPVEALQGTIPPPFLCKTYDMVSDPQTDSIVSWSSTNNSFIVWNAPEFIKQLLPKYFKHSNFSSFVRQLNTYGFRKVDPDRWEFAAEGFLRGQKHLLRAIHRRKPVSQNHSQTGPISSKGMCVEVGRFGGLEGEIEQLKRDKNVLMQELLRIRQQQQTTEQNMKALGQRLLITEQRQQQILAFLGKAMHSPSFLAQILQQSKGNKYFEDSRKRRCLPKKLPETDKDALHPSSSQGQIVKFQTTSAELPQTMIINCINDVDMAYQASPSHNLQEVPLDVKQDVDEPGYDSDSLFAGNQLISSTWTLESNDVSLGTGESSPSNISNSLSTESVISHVENGNSAMDQTLDVDIGEYDSMEMGFPNEGPSLYPLQQKSSVDDDVDGTVMDDNAWEQFLDGILAFEKVGLEIEGINSLENDLAGLITSNSDSCILQS